jgi:hypothetical protein
MEGAGDRTTCGLLRCAYQAGATGQVSCHKFLATKVWIARWPRCDNAARQTHSGPGAAADVATR